MQPPLADLAGGDYVIASSSRRALWRMQAEGLVDGNTYFPERQGQPVKWKITDEGRAALERTAPGLLVEAYPHTPHSLGPCGCGWEGASTPEQLAAAERALVVRQPS